MQLVSCSLRIIYAAAPFFLFAVLFFVQPVFSADYTNSIGMEFNNIPAGSFYMGSCKASREEPKRVDRSLLKAPEFSNSSASEGKVDCPSGGVIDKYAFNDETPQHKVVISKHFQMGVYEVTLGQFKQFIKEAGREDLLTKKFKESNQDNIKDAAPGKVKISWHETSPDCAVGAVSWHDTQDFIDWLNQREGGSHYRLPTEAEWEYAARAGTTTDFSWGSDKRQAGRYAMYCIAANQWYPHGTGQKRPNPWGLYDMHGNVREWTQDWFDADYYTKSPEVDPQGPSTLLRVPSMVRPRARVIRSGGRYDFLINLRSAARGINDPEERRHDLGFRLVREP